MFETLRTVAPGIVKTVAGYFRDAAYNLGAASPGFEVVARTASLSPGDHATTDTHDYIYW